MKGHHVRQPHFLFVQHHIQLDIGAPEFLREMRLPDRITAEFFPHELLQQQFANRLQRGIGQEQFQAAAAVFHFDPQARQHRRIGQPGDGGKTWVNFQPLEAKGHRT